MLHSLLTQLTVTVSQPMLYCVMSLAGQRLAPRSTRWTDRPIFWAGQIGYWPVQLIDCPWVYIVYCIGLHEHAQLRTMLHLWAVGLVNISKYIYILCLWGVENGHFFNFSPNRKSRVDLKTNLTQLVILYRASIRPWYVHTVTLLRGSCLPIYG
jgi:hypothetical protein